MTVNESSVGFEPPARNVGLSQTIQDNESLQQVDEINVTASNSKLPFYL